MLRITLQSLSLEDRGECVTPSAIGWLARKYWVHPRFKIQNADTGVADRFLSIKKNRN